MNPLDAGPPQVENPEHGDALRVSLRSRPLLLFLLVGTGILLASVFAVTALSRLNDQMDRVVTSLSDRTDRLARLRQAMLLMRVQEKNMVAWADEDQLRDFESRFHGAQEELDRSLRELSEQGIAIPAESVERLRQQLEVFRAEVEKVAQMSRRDTLREAVELSRGRGRDLYREARDILLQWLDRSREAVANADTNPVDLRPLAQRAARVRASAELLHDLLFLEQSVLIPLVPEDRPEIVAQMKDTEQRLLAELAQAKQGAQGAELADLERVEPVLERWFQSSAQVRQLAIEDSKAQALRFSTSAVRQVYLQCSDLLDTLLQEGEKEMAVARQSHERTLNLGRIVVLVSGLLGVAVVGGLLVLLVQQIIGEYRRAADSVIESR